MFSVKSSILNCILLLRGFKALATGKLITVQNQISMMSADDWEDFIEEWMTVKSEYYDFEKLGGAGDQGRDVIGYVTNPVRNDNYIWDNYQCKHYSYPLRPSNIWVEIGKVCHYSYIKEYPFPRKYYFISPIGIGTKLSNLLKKPSLLKQDLYDNWENYCRSHITDTKPIDLTEDFRKYIESLDFTVFDKIPTIKIINEHSKTRFHCMRFNVPLPPKPLPLQPPPTLAHNEINYVNKLIQAYNSHCLSDIKDVDTANKTPTYQKHLKRSREDFFHAETLRNFSRESLPVGEFEILQSQFLNGILDIVESEHPNGFERVKAAVVQSKMLQLPITPLTACLTPNERGGICQQLANNNEVSWCDDV